MASSGSSGGNTPNIPSPPSGMIAGQGQAAPFNPQFTNFLPTDPNAMATGLTPEMLAGIDTPAPAPAPAAGGGGSSYAQMLDFLQQMQGGGGTGRPSVINYNPNANIPNNRPSTGISRPQFNIPAPPSGATGVAPADMAAYQAAMQQQNAQREQLAEQMARQNRRQFTRGGNR